MVNVNMAGFEVDELQFGVSVSGPSGNAGKVLIDPSSKGRVHGAFHGKNRERQPIYVDDQDSSQDVVCEVTGRLNGTTVASGNTTGSLRLHELTEVTVVLGRSDLPGRGDTGGETPIDGGADTATGDDGSSPIDVGSGGSGGHPDGNSGTGGRPDAPGGGSGGSGGHGGSGGQPGMPGGGSGGHGGSGGQPGMPGGGSGGRNGSGGAPGTGGTPGTGGAPGTGGHPGMPGGGSGGMGGPMPPPLKGKGATCQSKADCATGFCVDGICCAVPCIGGCRVCNDPSARGDCRMVTAGGHDPRGSCQARSSCDANGTCDGNGGCAFARAGTDCGAASCKNKNFVIPGSKCDGSGVCLPGTSTVKCDKGLMCLNGACL
jgi:hypothetical protein